MKSLQGRLLVASPKLRDPNFYQSVVLMVQHDDEGAMGLVINRPVDVGLSSLLQNGEQNELLDDAIVGIGGPIGGPLMAVHQASSLGDTEVISGVYFSSRPDHVLTIAKESDTPHRFFVGYAGWAPGQLENEMEMGGWLSMPATKSHIFEIPAEEIWGLAKSAIGDQILTDTLRIKKIPSDPGCN